MILWFSTCARTQAERIAAEGGERERFEATGLRASFKFGLAKLLWLKERDPSLLRGAVWLSASDYSAYRLTGNIATDYTLAARSFAFRIDRKEWDGDWIRHFGLPTALFPEAYPSGTVVGRVSAEAAAATGVPAGVPVVIAGHDHPAASLGVGVLSPGRVMDSIGTAETLVGLFPERRLTERDLASGLSFGLHPVSGHLFWMGGISASGGSVEWLRAVLSDDGPGYERILALAAEAAPGPTGILYYPYLSGSGAPMPDADAKAAFVGLSASHGQADMLKAVLEGTAYEMESIRRAAEAASGAPITEMVATGGGTRNPHWLQIKADVSGCPLQVPDVPEAALLGAALLAGTGCGLFADIGQAAACAARHSSRLTVEPGADVHAAYRRLYEQGYAPLQQPLRRFYKLNSGACHP
jgi:xylulokinase